MRTRTVALALGLMLSVTAGLVAQSAATRAEYLTPPKAIVDILDAEPLPGVSVGPARQTIALVSRRSMPTIEEVAQPMLRLAGLRINPRNNGPHRMPSGTSITLRNVLDGTERKVSVPPDARIGGVSFSPDGQRLFFTNTREDRVDLYIADTSTGQSRMVETPLNDIAAGCDWLSDGSAILCGFVPAGRGRGV